MTTVGPNPGRTWVTHCSSCFRRSRRGVTPQRRFRSVPEIEAGYEAGLDARKGVGPGFGGGRAVISVAFPGVES